MASFRPLPPPSSFALPPPASPSSNPNPFPPPQNPIGHHRYQHHHHQPYNPQYSGYNQNTNPNPNGSYFPQRTHQQQFPPPPPPSGYAPPLPPPPSVQFNSHPPAQPLPPPPPPPPPALKKLPMPQQQKAARSETEEERRARKKREHEEQRARERRQQMLRQSQASVLQKTKEIKAAASGTHHQQHHHHHHHHHNRPDSMAGSRMMDRRAGEDRIENRLKKPTTFLCKLKFRNELPDPTAQPKLLSMNTNRDQYTKYAITSLEKMHKPKIYPEHDLGIPLDLLDLSVYNTPKGCPPLAPEDEELLCDGKVANPVKNKGIRKKERPTDKGVSWLVKTQYISPLSMDAAKLV